MCLRDVVNRIQVDVNCSSLTLCYGNLEADGLVLAAVVVDGGEPILDRVGIFIVQCSTGAEIAKICRVLLNERFLNCVFSATMYINPA
jgi:hypothetical protein